MRWPRQILGERRQRRSRWPLVLVGGAGVLVACYGLVLANLGRGESNVVSVDERDVGWARDRVTLQVEVASLDPGAGTVDLRVQPVPHGRFAAADGGSLQGPLRLQVTSPGQAPQSFELPAGPVVAPVAATATTRSGASRFPFDRPQGKVRLELHGAGDGAAVPADVELTDETEGWNLKAVVEGGLGDGQAVTLQASRELLDVSFALFYIGGVLVVALVTVVVIREAVGRSGVDFQHLIWLGAMLVAIPAVRNEMPGVPPVGTLVDLFVFLPAVVLVVMALLVAIVVLMTTRPDDDPDPAGLPDRATPAGRERPDDERSGAGGRRRARPATCDDDAVAADTSASRD